MMNIFRAVLLQIAGKPEHGLDRRTTRWCDTRRACSIFPSGNNRLHVAQVAVLLAIASAPLLAQQQPIALDMASVAARARTDSWETKRAHQESEAANWVARRTASLRWGRVGVQTQYLRFDDPITIKSPLPSYLVPVLHLSDLSTQIAPQDNFHVKFEAGLPLFTGGKITNGVKEAKAGARAERALESKTEADVVFGAEQNYLSLLLARDVLKLNQDALGSYREHLNHANSYYRQGTAAKYDVIRAEAAVSEQERRLTEAQNQVDLAEAALRSVLVLSDAEPIDIRGGLFEIDEPVEMHQTIADAVHASPALRALDEKIQARKSDVRVQFGDYLPQVAAIAGREAVTNKIAQTDPTWYAGARLSLDLFDGGERRARIGEAKANLQDSRYERQHAEDQIALAVRSAVLDLRAKQASLAAARKTAELAQESLRLATKRFEVGTGTSLEVLDATLAVTASQVNVQQALYGIDLAYLTIHRHHGDIADVAARIQK
jgi:outer membrane protein TolC